MYQRRSDLFGSQYEVYKVWFDGGKHNKTMAKKSLTNK